MNNFENNKENLQTQNGVTADTAGADREIAAAGLGKFKDVGTLIKAYSELEAEFTRRSQRLKELEKGNKTEPLPDGDKALSSKSDDELVKSALSNEKVRDAVIGEYLKSLQSQAGAPVTVGGGGVSAPRNVPKTVKEAGRLAREFLRS
ncbi:MAG: hypothetical protein K2L12_07375 [Clostridia bacterium]|nr:hypothetical protein [Clostridia bacterium]